jgi:lipid-A-disaccharide synthase
MKPIRVMLVAAEASGDALGAKLAQALRRRLGADVSFMGVGGARMAEEGVHSPFDIAELSILGWIEGLKAYGRVVRRVRETVELARNDPPDVAILIDSWGFTLRVAKGLRDLFPDLPLIKYVGPQVWASRPGRAKTLAERVDHLLAIHVFDPPWFEREGLATTFVGNPAVFTDFSAADGARFRAGIGAGPDDPILLVLPGSRPSEIERMTPPFEEAVALLKQGRPELHVVVAAAETVAEQVRGRVAGWPFRVHLVEGENGKHDAMKAATVALACSGTVSTELALAGAPMVISYRVDALTYALAKHVVTTKLFTLFNIAAGEAIAPELIQADATGPKLAAAVAERLGDPALRTRQIAQQYAALDKMGRGGRDPSEIAAEAVIGVLADRGRI